MRVTVRSFLWRNRRALLFLLCFLGGAAAGVAIFFSLHASTGTGLDTLLCLPPVEGGILGGVRSALAACFSALILLTLLFIAGLSAVGVPLTVLIPFFYGLQCGITQSYYYAKGWAGVLTVTLLYVLPTLVALGALVLGSVSALDMTVSLTRQLLPRANAAGLWPQFRRYLWRFAAYLGVVLVSGAVSLLLRLAFGWLLT